MTDFVSCSRNVWIGWRGDAALDSVQTHTSVENEAVVGLRPFSRITYAPIFTCSAACTAPARMISVARR